MGRFFHARYVLHCIAMSLAHERRWMQLQCSGCRRPDRPAARQSQRYAEHGCLMRCWQSCGSWPRCHFHSIQDETQPCAQNGRSRWRCRPCGSWPRWRFHSGRSPLPWPSKPTTKSGTCRTAHSLRQRCRQTCAACLQDAQDTSQDLECLCSSACWHRYMLVLRANGPMILLWLKHTTRPSSVNGKLAPWPHRYTFR